MHSNKGHSDREGSGKEGVKKKAFVKMEIIKIILIIFSFLLLFYFIYEFYSKATEFANEQACHDSVVLIESLVQKAGYGTEYKKPWPAVCKTKDIISKAKTVEAAEKEIAERMVWCYWMMGEGVVKPFNKDIFWGGRKCYACYTMQFPYLKGQIAPQDFMFYLKANGRKDITYYDYLKYGQDKIVDTPLADFVDNKRVYAIVYSNPADPTIGSILTCVGAAWVGAKVGGGVGFTVGAVAGMGVASAPAAAAAGGVGAVAGAVVGFVGCAAVEIPANILEALKDDMVYVYGLDRGKPSCYGTWYAYTEEMKSS